MAAVRLSELSPSGDDLRRVFRELAETWRRETGMLSSVTENCLHPAYQQIIGLGPPVVPLLLQELEREPDHWFWALSAITRADPVPPEDLGNMRRMAAKWLAFGREKGYSWR